MSRIIIETSFGKTFEVCVKGLLAMEDGESVKNVFLKTKEEVNE